jgi:hypothetical protein
LDTLSTTGAQGQLHLYSVECMIVLQQSDLYTLEENHAANTCFDHYQALFKTG